MKREAVNTSFLLAITCLLIYVAVLLTQKPSLQDIDQRIEYWHDYYDIQLKRLRRDKQDEEEFESASEADMDSPAYQADPKDSSSTLAPESRSAPEAASVDQSQQPEDSEE